MDRAFYFERLYPFQDRILAVIGGADTGFYLTGGTAASRGYLQHRFSDDLDLFVNDAPQFALWATRIIECLRSRGEGEVSVLVRDERFVRFTVGTSDVDLKIELVNDVPAHAGIITDHAVLGRLDSAENILANKISALVDREEPKDLADVWAFCCRMNLSIASALEDAQSKAAGLFPADVARLLLSANESDWQMVRWIAPPDAEQFMNELHALGEKLIFPS
jgi:predicted nucleotidyltransferase component of viral defense system